MQKGTISVQTENIFPIIKKFLYSDQEIFLRELVSNAVDATTKLKALTRAGKITGEPGELTIDVLLDKEAGTLTIRDRGIGMTSEEVLKYLNQVAFSSAREFLEQYEDAAGIIGHFGLGFYSAFMVASKVEVHTRSWQEGSEAVRWICEGKPEYELQPGDRDFRGTDVILHIAEDSAEYLEKDRIEGLLKKYCAFLPVEVRFGKKTETHYEGEGEDAKAVSTEVENIINDTDPAWKKQPADVSENQYKALYDRLYPYSPEPLFWIHLNIDYPFNLQGILYFPREANPTDLQRNKIQLYSNQVYVTDQVKDIVPEFLTLLHGVIDSPDIPLNVSRSYLQADSNVKKITGYITKKVADKLNELFKNDRENYEAKWPFIGTFVKYGMLTEEKFHERAMDFCLLKDTEGAFYTIEDYKNKIEPAQKDKHGKIIALYTTEPDAHEALIDQAAEKGYSVLQLDPVIDSHLIQHLEYKGSGLTFARVDADTTDKLIEKEDSTGSVLSEEEEKHVKDVFEKLEVIPGAQVSLRAMSPEDPPVSVVRPEFMRRMREMQAMRGVDMGKDDFVNIVVNANHPVVFKKLSKAGDTPEQQEAATFLLEAAMLQQGMLKGKRLNAFVKKSLDQWLKSV